MLSRGILLSEGKTETLVSKTPTAGEMLSDSMFKQVDSHKCVSSVFVYNIVTCYSQQSYNLYNAFKFTQCSRD